MNLRGSSQERKIVMMKNFLCCCDVLIAHGGRSDLTKHEMGDKHQKAIQAQATSLSMARFLSSIDTIEASKPVIKAVSLEVTIVLSTINTTILL